MQEAIKLLMTFDAGESPIWRELLIPRHATAGDLGRWLAIAAGYKGTESWEILCREFKMRITEDRALLNEAKALKAERAAEAEAKGEEVEETPSETVIVYAGDLPLWPFLKDHPNLTFLYDMTDEWRWRLSAEPMDEPVDGDLPRLVQGIGTAPFVGVGGLQGYYEVLGHLTENGPQADEIRDWLEDQDLYFFDADRVQAVLKVCAAERKNR